MTNLKIHFLKLTNLFEGHDPIFPTLRFDIKGDHTHFTIKKVLGYPYLYAVLFVLVFVVPFLWMIPSNLNSARFWLVELFILGVAGVVFRFFVASRSITIDSVNKSILQRQNNIFGWSISKPLLIPFHEFKGFSSREKSKTVNKFGQKVVYQGIYMLYNDQKKFLFDLPSNFQLGDSPTTFIQCMEAIVKNE